MILGLLTLSGRVADGLLRKAGHSVKSVEGYLFSRRPTAVSATIQDGIPLSTSGLAAIERAEARARQFTYLGIEHLLLGILAEDHAVCSRRTALARRHDTGRVSAWPGRRMTEAIVPNGP